MGLLSVPSLHGLARAMKSLLVSSTLRNIIKSAVVGVSKDAGTFNYPEQISFCLKPETIVLPFTIKVLWSLFTTFGIIVFYMNALISSL